MGRDPMRTVLILNFVRTPFRSHPTIDQTIHIDLYKLINLDTKNHVVP